jgi:hypothetical protein
MIQENVTLNQQIKDSITSLTAFSPKFNQAISHSIASEHMNLWTIFNNAIEQKRKIIIQEMVTQFVDLKTITFNNLKIINDSIIKILKNQPLFITMLNENKMAVEDSSNLIV